MDESERKIRKEIDKLKEMIEKGEEKTKIVKQKKKLDELLKQYLEE